MTQQQVQRIEKQTVIEQIADIYENDHPLFPFLCMGLSWLGLGVVDRMLSRKAAAYTTKRLENLMTELEQRVNLQLQEPSSDVFMSALYQCLPGVLETQSTEKVRMFAEILADTWNNEEPSWDEVAQSLRLVRQLEDIHIFILKEALKLSPEQDGETVTFSVGGKGYPSSIAMEDRLPHIESMFIVSCVSDLIALGLINDSFSVNGGVFGFGNSKNSGPKESPQAYSISPLGRWLLTRLADPSQAETAN